MKSYIFLVSFILSGFVANSQTTLESANANDKNSRAVVASYYLDIPVNFDSPMAEACVNLLLSAHRNGVSYPVLPIDQLNGNDQNKVKKLQDELEALRINPPSWNYLLAKEEAKLAVKYAAPTAPVFAGDVDRTNAPKNAARIVSTGGGSYKFVEQSIQNNEEPQSKTPEKN